MLSQSFKLSLPRLEAWYSGKSHPNHNSQEDEIGDLLIENDPWEEKSWCWRRWCWCAGPVTGWLVLFIFSFVLSESEFKAELGLKWIQSVTLFYPWNTLFIFHSTNTQSNSKVKGSSHPLKTVKEGTIVPFGRPPPLNGLKVNICCLITDKSA